MATLILVMITSATKNTESMIMGYILLWPFETHHNMIYQKMEIFECHAVITVVIATTIRNAEKCLTSMIGQSQSIVPHTNLNK
jgi:hypothetical protein